MAARPTGSRPAAANDASASTQPDRRILRLAHRGDWRVAPENSLAALVTGALATHADGIEFDVHLASDGTPVVIHDPTLERVQGTDAAVASLSSEALASLGVPDLASVLAAVPDSAFLDVELKVVPNSAVKAALLSARGRTPQDAVVSSFLPDAVRALGRLLPGWRRWLNSRTLDDDIVALAQTLQAHGIAAEWRAITPAAARRVHDAGLDLVAFTVTREATVRRLEDLGVMAACVEGRPLD